MMAGKHAKKKEVSGLRWFQLLLGALLTWGGLIWLLQVSERGDANIGSKSAPVELAAGFVVMVIGMLMLVHLLHWAIFGKKEK